MNSKFSLLSFMFFLVFGFIANSQLAQVGMTGSGDILITASSQLAGRATINIPLNELDFEGSPYIEETYKSGKIIYVGKPVRDILFRYNAYNEEIEVKKSSIDSDSLKALKRDKKIAILANGRTLKFLYFTDKLKRRLHGYLFSIVDNKYSLYKRENVKFSEPKRAQTSFEKNVSARFTKFEAFYIGINNQDILEISNSKNKFLEQLPLKTRKKTAEFIKSKKLKVKLENDLIQIIEFLNTIED